jgi:microcystin-dependent protein
VSAFTAAGASYGTTADLEMSPTGIGATGAGDPVTIVPPYLALMWCIAVQGQFLQRN